MKELLEFVVKKIVADPKKVSVEETNETGVLLMKLSVGEEDMGKVIGKGGKVVKALRTLLKIPTLKSGQKAYLELIDPKKS